MAEYVGDGVKTYEPDVDNLIRAIYGHSVLSGCGVTAQAVPDMTVAVASGTIRYNAAKVTVAAVASLAIAAADPTNQRIDAVVVNSAGTVSVQTGTPSATPKPPALPASSIILGYVAVAAAAANIQNSNISNRRLLFGTDIYFDGSVSLAGAVKLTATSAAAGTGIFSPAANALAVTINSVEKHRYHASGGVSFGSTIDPVTSGHVRAVQFQVGGLNSNGEHVHLENSSAFLPMVIKQSGVGADSNIWDWQLNGTQLNLRVVNDAYTAATIALQVTRAGSTVSGVTIGGPTTVSGSFVAIGTNPAQSGVLRIPTGQRIVYRNNANTGDVVVMDVGTRVDVLSVFPDTYFSGLVAVGSTTLLTSTVALTNGAAAQTGTLTNAPAAGNPTKWVPINDNGTTRYIPAW